MKITSSWLKISGYGEKYHGYRSKRPNCTLEIFRIRETSVGFWVIEPDVRSFSISTSRLNSAGSFFTSVSLSSTSISSPPTGVAPPSTLARAWLSPSGPIEADFCRFWFSTKSIQLSARFICGRNRVPYQSKDVGC